jgi:outer membrane autotransporter protein
MGGHFYNEGAIRFGKAENDFNTGLYDDLGESGRYETDSSYYGAHFTLGYIKYLRDTARMNFYTRLLWTHLDGDDVRMSTGDEVSFDGTDSMRWRFGLRYYAPERGDGKFYFGAAYEYEFDSDVASSSYGFKIDAPSMDGGTGIAEIGYIYRKYKSPFSANFNVSGYFGKREGFGTRLDLNWQL